MNYYKLWPFFLFTTFNICSQQSITIYLQTFSPQILIHKNVDYLLFDFKVIQMLCKNISFFALSLISSKTAAQTLCSGSVCPEQQAH